MLRLEHDAHGARAKPFEHAVVVYHQSERVVAFETIDLELGHQLELQEASRAGRHPEHAPVSSAPARRSSRSSNKTMSLPANAAGCTRAFSRLCLVHDFTETMRHAARPVEPGSMESLLSAIWMARSRREERSCDPRPTSANLVDVFVQAVGLQVAASSPSRCPGRSRCRA